MAKRFIDTDLFRKPFMRSLEAPYKALWIYLLCECDHAGIWVVELDVAQIRLGMKLDPDKVLDKMQGAVVSIDDGTKWYLPDFVAFQYGTLNPLNRVHASGLSRLQALGIDPTDKRENKGLTSPLQGAKDKDKDKDTQGRKERASAGPEFTQWWTIYAKGSRKLSEAEWQKLSSQDREACLKQTPAFIASKPDKVFRKDGERYLKNRTWEDPIVGPSTTQSNGKPRELTYTEARAELDAIRAANGIAPGGFLSSELIPPHVTRAMHRPQTA